MPRKKRSYYNRGIPTPKYETGPNCEGCPYRDWSQGYVPGDGDLDAKYMVLAENPAYEELLEGRPLVGGSGDVTWGIMRDHSDIKRSDCYVDNVVRCRTIKWVDCAMCGGSGCDSSYEIHGYEIQCQQGKVPEISKHTRDFVNVEPDPRQAAECTRRYLLETLDRFKGDTILGMGTAPLRAVANRNIKITQYQGTVFERGEMDECSTCEGAGVVVPTRERKCKECNGGKPVWQEPRVLCESHPRYKARAKSRRTDCACLDVYASAYHVPDCGVCNNTRVIHVKLKPRKCAHCKGEGATFRGDFIDANVSKLLKPGQLFIATFHPAYIMRDATKKPAFKQTIGRLVGLHDEGKTDEVDYSIEVFPDDKLPGVVGRMVAADIENPRNGDPWSDGYTMCSVATGPRDVVVYHPGDPRLLRVLEDAEVVVGQNYLLHDAWWLYRNEGIVPNKIWDTRFAGHLLNPDTPHNLSSMTVEFAQPSMSGFWKSRQNYATNLAGVCGVDSIAAWRVRTGQIEALRKSGQLHIMEDHIVPLTSVLFDIRRHGIKVDEEGMRSENQKLRNQIAEMREQLPFEGTELSHHVASHLYDHYKLPQVDEKFGPRNTRENTLRTLSDRISIGQIDIGVADREVLGFIDLVLSLRTLSKLSSGFFSYKLRDSRIHPALNPAGAATLRLSCSDPNVQQVPAAARHIFLPDLPGWSLTAVDVDQAEIVTFLWLAQEWDLYNQVLSGYDIHALTAEILGVDRKTAKIANFAMLFNEEPETTAARQRMPLYEAVEMHSNYHKKMKGVKNYQREVLNFARQYGYVETPFKTRRHIPISYGQNRGHAVNQAVNAPIQGTPAYLTREVMVRAAAELPKPARLWMQIHDEVVVTHPTEMRDEVIECLLENFQTASKLAQHPLSSSTTPLRFNLSVKTGESWGKMRNVPIR